MMTPSTLFPPESVRGMTILDKSKFIKQAQVPVLKVSPNLMNAVLVVLKAHLLKLEKFKPVQNSAEGKLVFLNPDFVKNFDCFSEDMKACLLEMNVTCQDLSFTEVMLNYDNWKAHEIISSVLPPPLSFSGFSIIGHIIHVNLRDALLPYKKLIGLVLLEKTKNCKSVVNKVTTIQNTFRNFEMEILAGSDDLKTETQENGCRYELNFADVYWNPRLHEEHGRIISLLNPGDVLFDVYCGIGPFTIPAAKNGCEVYANDLNPSCCQWLQHNAALNKVTDRITVCNKHGGDFLKIDFREAYLERIHNVKYKSSKFHIVMNLPATAYEELVSFKYLFLPEELLHVEEKLLPIVHVYCFVNGIDKNDGMLSARNLVEKIMDMKILDEKINLFHVRKVSPNKDMIRVSFTLMKNYLISRNIELSSLQSISAEGSEKFEMNSLMNCDKKRPALPENGITKKMRLY